MTSPLWLYSMVGQLTTPPYQSVYWSVFQAPDTTGQYSGYFGQLQNITVVAQQQITFPSNNTPTIDANSLNGVPLDNSAPANGQALVFIQGNNAYVNSSVAGVKFNPTQFGSPGNAQFFNAANGKWYQDQALTIEASDDAPGFRAVQAYVAGLGGGSIYIPPGNWYFKTTVNGVFVPTASSITWFGDGDASAIWVAPGLNTVGIGGWSTVFGPSPFSPGSAVNSVQFLRFSVHCNGQFNQWPSSNFGGPLPHYTNTPISVPLGNNIVVDGVSIFDHVGPFAILVGLYGNPSTATNYTITNNVLNHMGDDPNVGDISWISCSGTNGVVSGNRIDYAGSAANVAWGSVGGAPACAIECHGFNTVVGHNVTNGTASAINFAADSFDGGSLTFTGNLLKNCTAGFSGNAINGHAMRGLKITDNTIFLRATGNSSAPENGITYSSFSTLSVAIGLGMFDVQISNNLVIGATTPTANSSGLLLQQHQTGGNSITIATWQASHSYSPFHLQNTVVPTSGIVNYFVCTAAGTSGTNAAVFAGATPGQVVHDGGVTWLCVAPTSAPGSAVVLTGGGTTVSRNRIRGFANYGIVMTVPDGSGANNLCEDVHIYNNELLDVGPTGIAVGGSTGDLSADFVGLEILSNTIVDDRGGSSALVNPVTINAWTDITSVWQFNHAIGYSGGAIVNVSFSSSHGAATNYWPSETFRQITSAVASVGTTVFPGMLLQNTTNASSGATAQYAPAVEQTGSYWNGAAPVECGGITQLIAASTPAMAWSTQTANGAWTVVMQSTFVSSSKVTWATGTSQLVIDLSGGSGRSFIANVDSAGTAGLQVGSTVMVGATGTSLFFYGAAGQAQASRVGQITDTHGTGGSSIAASDGTNATLDNNLRTIVNYLNGLEAIIHGTGLSA